MFVMFLIKLHVIDLVDTKKQAFDTRLFSCYSYSFYEIVLKTKKKI